MNRKWRWLIPAVMLGFASPLLAMHLAAPAWQVTVVDKDGNPMSNVVVTETWQDYSCESENHTVQLKTDAQGRVQFPAVHVHRNPLRCARETASELAAGVHASLGMHARIDVDGLLCVVDTRGYCIDWTGHPSHMSTRVVFH